MGNWQGKATAGAAWADVPQAAWQGTAEGVQAVLVYPEFTALDGNGRQVGAFGLPQVVIESAVMSQAGWAHWLGAYGTATANGGTYYLTAWDAQAGSFVGRVGLLQRPAGRCVPGPTAAETLYHDVRIVLAQTQAATWP